jgi:short subunit dehydrogenase-like uncharacterized protein
VSWLLYGANGYTGELTAREAVRRGLRPILAGRSREPVESLARELGLEWRSFSLQDAAAIRFALRGVKVVLHCAGPFSATAAPMIDMCVTSGAHYLDITGEISVFELAQQRSAEAAAAGVVLCPGVGFDVVPTDSIALALKDALPTATHLALGFDGKSSFSRGTGRTMVEGLGQGGAARVDGRIVTVPLGWKDRLIDFGAGEKLAMTIPWGDVSTAYHTTGIPNVEVYIPMSPRRVAQLRRMNYVRPLLGLSFVQNWLKARVDRQPPGPDAAQRERTPTYVWGEARDAAGAVRTARIVVANGYTVTVHASLGVVERLLTSHVDGGATTPARLMGRNFIETLPGSTAIAVTS